MSPTYSSTSEKQQAPHGDEKSNGRENGSTIPAGYRGDEKIVLDLMARALATTLSDMLHNWRQVYAARSDDDQRLSTLFGQFCHQAHAQADALAERIMQLGGRPQFDPAHLVARSYFAYLECATPEQMIRHTLQGSRCTIEGLRQTIDYIGADDPATRSLLEAFMSRESAKAEELTTMLCAYG